MNLEVFLERRFFTYENESTKLSSSIEKAAQNFVT